MNINLIFDAAMAVSSKIHEEDRRRRELADLTSRARRECGNCYWWMMSNRCPRERNVNGRNHGPNMSSLPCDKFTSTAVHAQAEAELAAKIEAGATS